jgi:hypothetical protein
MLTIVNKLRTLVLGISCSWHVVNVNRYFCRLSEAVDTSDGLGDLEAKAHIITH